MSRPKLTPIIIFTFILLGICFWFNRVLIFDCVSALLYHPSAEIAKIEDNIALTSRAGIIFEAASPSLEDRDAFNLHCDSHDQEISILGCYAGGRIYIYNINSSDLNGVVESTAAHELLHAVWERLDAGTKNSLSALLTDVYNNSRYHDLLAEDLETYSETDRIDELHSRIGTEIADLPDELEQHYARYFINQDLVVDYYDNYIEPFRELSNDMDQLTKELEDLDAEIESKTEEYYRRSEDLAQRIDEFNSCANTAGCFTIDSVFNSARNTLVQEQSALEDLFDDLNSLVDRYNDIVAEYNENVLRSETLEKAINSNSEPESIINSK